MTRPEKSRFSRCFESTVPGFCEVGRISNMFSSYHIQSYKGGICPEKLRDRYRLFLRPGGLYPAPG